MVARKPRRPAIPTAPAGPPPLFDKILHVGPAPTRVIVTWRRALSSPREEREIVWPAGWRLPAVGDAVTLETGEGGFVEYVDFDLGRRALRVNVR